MKFEIHRRLLELFCLTPCRSAQTTKKLNRESLCSDLSRGTSYMTSSGKIIRSCKSVTSNTVHTKKHAHKLYTFGFLLSSKCFGNTFWPSTGRKIEVQKETCCRRDLSLTINLLIKDEILFPKEEY